MDVPNPRAILRALISTQCSDDRKCRDRYYGLGLKEHFVEEGPSKDPIEVLALFLECFATEGGSWNEFASPLALVAEYLDQTGYQCSLQPLLERLRDMMDRGEASQANISVLIQGVVRRRRAF